MPADRRLATIFLCGFGIINAVILLGTAVFVWLLGRFASGTGGAGAGSSEVAEFWTAGKLASAFAIAGLLLLGGSIYKLLKTRAPDDAGTG